MSLRDEPHYTLPAAELARWIESQPDLWWLVDEPQLMSVLDLPCPSDELAPAIRKIGKDLLVSAKTCAATAHGELIGADRLGELADVSNWRHQRTFLMSWADSEVPWELWEDEPLVEQ